MHLCSYIHRHLYCKICNICTYVLYKYLVTCSCVGYGTYSTERERESQKLKHPQSSFAKKFKMYIVTFVHEYPWLVATYISEIHSSMYVVLVDTSCCKDGGI